MSRTQITRHAHPQQYDALIPILKAIPDLVVSAERGLVRVPDERGWIVQSPMHAPYFECDVWQLDADGKLVADPASPDDLLLEPVLRRIELPAGFPLPEV